ncbi:MAG: DUF1178 family protein [Burkholderiales bacterium]|nr:DUF1178 family protein [Burkholderiales bacterium]
MIVFELICSKRHRFEGWFASAETFDRQSAHGQITCPVCASPDVRKVPSARVTKPRAKRPVASPEASSGAQRPPERSPASEPAAPRGDAVTKTAVLAAFIDHVLANTEDVGTRFAEEARRIHYGEVAKRSIRGEATRGETEELVDEGVPVMQLPIPPKDGWQ